MSEFQHLFTPIKVGPRTVKNRICCSAHVDALAKEGMPGGETRRYYEEKAIGGVGFIMCFGSAAVHRSSPARDWNGIELFDDKVIPYLRSFSDTMHRYDVPVVAQITHRGRRGRTTDLRHRLYSASDVREPNHRETPHPLDEQMIDEIVEAFAAAAGRLKQGGFDGCEVMASHCHLIDQFFSPLVNFRDDQYGGSLENRLRLGVRVLERVRETAGDDFIVGIRITGDDFLKRGLGGAQMREIAAQLNALKIIDYFNVIGATAETYVGEAAAVPDMSFPLGTYRQISASIRAVVNVPVMVTGRVVDPLQADEILAAGEADLCIMNRALISDPHMPNKARAGQLDDIRICAGYNEGCIDRIYTGRGVTCVQNPVIGRELQWSTISRSAQRKRIVVVGGGPAGLEAARVCAERGHGVVLLEASAQLGGQTLIAKHAPGRGDYDLATRWSSAQCRKLGVDIRLNCSANLELIVAERPDLVIVATGAVARNPRLPGMETHTCASAWEVLLGRANDLGRRVLVIDEEYGHQGPTTAEFLLDAGKNVTLITSQETIANFLGATTRPPLLARLFKKRLEIIPHLEAQRLVGGKLIAQNTWSAELREVGPYDSFVYAYGGASVDLLSAPLKARGIAVEVVGDAFAPRTLQHAILEGHKCAREFA